LLKKLLKNCDEPIKGQAGGEKNWGASLKAEAFINVVILVITEIFTALFHPFQILKL
jgi:hypothetical protein